MKNNIEVKPVRICSALPFWRYGVTTDCPGVVGISFHKRETAEKWMNETHLRFPHSTHSLFKRNFFSKWLTLIRSLKGQ